MFILNSQLLFKVNQVAVMTSSPGEQLITVALPRYVTGTSSDVCSVYDCNRYWVVPFFMLNLLLISWLALFTFKTVPHLFMCLRSKRCRIYSC